ncbi:hypothetical protein ACL02S_23825 [Nocardia sp. 004]|uniref:hypothetical protein n=1 Tax=Nocardia sp. 004 TaxID=3385978 RepID=UPI0039A2A0A6
MYHSLTETMGAVQADAAALEHARAIGCTEEQTDDTYRPRHAFTTAPRQKPFSCARQLSCTNPAPEGRS